MKEDLGVKIGTKREVFLTAWLEDKEKALSASKIDVKLNEYAIKLLEEEIEKEKENLK